MLYIRVRQKTYMILVSHNKIKKSGLKVYNTIVYIEKIHKKKFNQKKNPTKNKN